MWKNEVQKQCKKCKASNEDRYLEICTSCREHFCRICAMHRHGKRFCSTHCADLFYFGDYEEDGDYG